MGAKIGDALSHVADIFEGLGSKVLSNLDLEYLQGLSDEFAMSTILEAHHAKLSGDIPKQLVIEAVEAAQAAGLSATTVFLTGKTYACWLCGMSQKTFLKRLRAELPTRTMARKLKEELAGANLWPWIKMKRMSYE